MAKRKINWYPARLIEDWHTGKTFVLMYGGSGRVRFVKTTEIQQTVWDEKRFENKGRTFKTSNK